VTHVTASDARQELFRLLDAVEKGEAVVVERRGVRFRLSLLEPAERKHASGSASPVEVSDPDVLSGNWTWSGDQDGQLQFRPRRKGR
jgi:antitoxin (DNA-binding transcriptional repressor) of toxin-antitoxin stability system